MSELYLKATNGGDFDKYFEALAGQITSYLAVDSNVRLECDRTLGFSIPASDWAKVVESIHAGLALVFYEISTKSPLSIPCSQALVELFVHQIWSPVSDSRGYIHIAVPLDPKSLDFSPEHSVIWSALFGESGYFETYRSHVVLAGNSYLAADGDYKPCQFYLGKEGKTSKKSKTVKSDVKIHTVHPSRKILRVHSAGEFFLRAQDASTDDFTGLAFLFPALSVQTPDAEVLKLRLVTTSPICEAKILPTNLEQDAAVRTVIWLFNATDHGFALRGTLAIRPSHGLIYDLQRTLLTVLSTYNKRDESDDLGPLPTSLGVVRLLNVCLLCLNPYLITLDTDFQNYDLESGYRLVHALHRVVRPLSCPTSLSESLRALRSVFIPYAGSSDSYAGMTLSCCVSEIGQGFAPIKSTFPWSAFSLAYFVPHHESGSPEFVLESKPTGRAQADILSYLRHLQSQVDFINQLGVTMSSLIQFAPALSYDGNRIPISSKYMIGCPVNNPHTTEYTNDYSDILEASDKSSPQELVYFDGLVHLLVLCESSNDMLCFLASSESYTKSTGSRPAVDDDRLAALTAYAHFTEFNSGTVELYNKNGLGSGKPSHGIPTWDPSSRDVEIYLKIISSLVDGDFDDTQHINIDVFTKIPGLERVADYITRCIYMPIVIEDNHSGSDQTSARLFLLGFLRSKTNISPEYLFHAQSNLRDPHNPAKAVAPSGALLMELSKKGGFGFGALLGPLLGEGAKAISSLFGAPEVGEAIAGVANIAGSLIPF